MDQNLVYIHMPAVFEVRCTEFSYALVNAVLVSWFALVSYFTASIDSAAQEHLLLLTSDSTMQLLTFFADVLFAFQDSNYVYSVTTTVVDIDMHELVVDNVKAKITQRKEDHLLRGWQEVLTKSAVKNTDGDMFLRGIKLRQGPIC